MLILWITSIFSATSIHILLEDLTEPAEKTFKLFQSQERELVNKYNYVVGLWRRVSEFVLLPFPFLQSCLEFLLFYFYFIFISILEIFLFGGTVYFQFNNMLSYFQISTVTGELRYGDAIRLLHTLEDASKGSAICGLISCDCLWID